jgi:small-conductance mechanosensitive channel
MVSFPSELTAPLEQTTQALAAYLPQLLGALALLAAGYLVARLVAGIFERVLRGVLHQVARAVGGRTTLGDRAVRQRTAAALAAVVFWSLSLVFVLAALRVLNVPVLDEALRAVTGYVPHLVAAIVVLGLGWIIGEAARAGVARSMAAAQVGHADVVGRIVQMLLVAVAVMAALEQLGMDATFLVVTVAAFVATTVGALGLAFGLGARDTVENLLAAHYLRRQVRPGDTVELGGVRGRVVEVEDTVLVLDSETGRTLVPAATASREIVRIAEDA